MPPNAVSRLHADREAQFLAHIVAIGWHEHEPIEGVLRSDVVMAMRGTSWLAGIHTGYEGVRRCLAGLRRVLHADDEQISFLHGVRHMIVRHDVEVHGPDNAVAMGLGVRVRYDDEEKIASLFVDPDDQGLFDHVANSLLSGSAAV